MLPIKPVSKIYKLKTKYDRSFSHTHTSELKSRGSPGRTDRFDFVSLLAGFQAVGSEYKQCLIQKGRTHGLETVGPALLHVHLKQPAPGSWITMDVTHGWNAQKTFTHDPYGTGACTRPRNLTFPGASANLRNFARIFDKLDWVIDRWSACKPVQSDG